MSTIPPEIAVALFIAAIVAAPDDDMEAEVDVNAMVERAKRGDREAVAALYQLYVRPTHRYIALRVGDVHDAEDLTAEVFVQMVKRLANYEVTGAPFAAWLYKIASTRIADYYRRKGSRTDQQPSDDLRDMNDTPEEVLQHEEVIDQLRQALNQLTEEQQVILVMRFVERKSHADVAAALGRSVTAVKSIQHRALITLTELLGSSEKVRHYLRGNRD